MKSTEKSTEILNDLLKINNDRIEGYDKAIEQSPDSDLKRLFSDMSAVSKKLSISLKREIEQQGGVAEVGSTTNSGKIYRIWMDVKANFTGKDRESILDACEFGEDAAQKAYKEALEDEDLSAELRPFIMEQKADLKAGHDLIKFKRDESKFAHNEK